MKRRLTRASWEPPVRTPIHDKCDGIYILRVGVFSRSGTPARTFPPRGRTQAAAPACRGPQPSACLRANLSAARRARRERRLPRPARRRLCRKESEPMPRIRPVEYAEATPGVRAAHDEAVREHGRITNMKRTLLHSL